MHHPEIYDLISIIEDFFIFTDTKFRCQIEPIFCNEPYHTNDTTCASSLGYKGLKVIRQLNHGRIEISIVGFDKDSDLADFYYFPDENPLQALQIIESENTKYNSDTARTTIRKLVIFDRDRKVEPKLHAR